MEYKERFKLHLMYDEDVDVLPIIVAISIDTMRTPMEFNQVMEFSGSFSIIRQFILECDCRTVRLILRSVVTSHILNNEDHTFFIRSCVNLSTHILMIKGIIINNSKYPIGFVNNCFCCCGCHRVFKYKRIETLEDNFVVMNVVKM